MNFPVKIRIGDITGAFGDAGTLAPLALGAIFFCKLSPFGVFLTFGILYIFTGLFYRIPVPVQPLKAATSLSIVYGLGVDYLRATSLIMALLIGLISVAGGKRLYRYFPHPIIRGLQFAVGLLLIKTGLDILIKGEIIHGWDFSGINTRPFSAPSLAIPDLSILIDAALLLVIPQIPLTIGNAIVATEDAAICYFGEKANRANVKNLCFTISTGNLLSFFLGGLPVCHGSGGMTAHYKFGARTGLATVITGVTMVITALLSWKLSYILTSTFVIFCVGISLIYIGLNHCLLSKDIVGASAFIVCVMGLTGLLTSNLTYSLISGYILFLFLNRRDQLKEKGLNAIKNAIKREHMRKEQLFDAYGRRVTYLRISVTDVCNLGCIYCKRAKDTHFTKKERSLSAEDIIKIAAVASSLGIEKVRITGGEPLIRKDILQILKGISSTEGIKDLSLTTNGVFLKEFARDLRMAGLGRINVSLDTLKISKFRIITGCDFFEKVLDGIREAKKAGLEPVKINVVMMRGFNDDEIEDFVDFSIREGVIIRFIELMPVGWNDQEWKERYISREEVIERIRHRLEEGITPFARRGDPARYYRLKEGGEIGIISPVSHSFCHECNRLRITSDGHLRSCMVLGREIDLKALLNKKDAERLLKEAFKDAVLMKPGRGFFVERALNVSKGMFEIGG